jgi:hypothetical protein
MINQPSPAQWPFPQWKDGKIVKQPRKREPKPVFPPAPF